MAGRCDAGLPDRIHPAGVEREAGVNANPGMQPALSAAACGPPLFLAAVTVAVFLPSLSADFVYDARLQILTDPFLHDRRNWWPVLTFQTLAMDVLDSNRPVHLASLMLDAAVWGRAAFGYHLTSILLHAANVVLLWAVGRRLSVAAAADPPRSGLDLAAALLPPLMFAVHPLVTEAVCEPSFREDLLVACFTLAALLLAAADRPVRGGGDWPRGLACAGCCLLAIGSKESGIAAPAILAVYWFLFRRGDPARFWAIAVGGGAAAVAVFLVLRFRLQVVPSRIFEHRPQYPDGSLAAALALLPRILALYAQLIVAPVNQSADYGGHSIRHLPLPVAATVVGLLAVAAARAARRDRRFALALALVVLPLLPVANLVPIYRVAADRYLYLPLAGVALAFGCLLDPPRLAGRDGMRRSLILGGCAATVALAIACTERQRVWSGSLPLWQDTFAKNPRATAAVGVAWALRETGRLEEAERWARTAIDVSAGELGESWATLAVVLEDRGRSAEARRALAKAIEADPRLARPTERVAALALERSYADALERLLDRPPAGP